MFETLTQKLSGAFAGLRGKRELDEKNVDEGLRDVRASSLRICSRLTTRRPPPHSAPPRAA